MTSTLLLSIAASLLLGPAPFYADKMDLLTVLAPDGTEEAVSAPAQWQLRREHILENMQRVMGPMPTPRATPPFDLQVIEEFQGDGYLRQKITFVTEGHDRLPAYLLFPDPPPTKAPAMVCLHPTSSFGKGMVVGLGDKPNRNYAEELARRGYVTLAPDYPTYGDYDIDVYAQGYVSATMKGIVNHMRAVDLLASLPQVDADRIGTIGHSLGGHNALFLAAFDERIRVAVSSCGFNRFSKYYGGDLTGWSHKGYMPRIASEFGKDPARMPFDWTEVLATIAPRPVFVSAPINDANFEVSGIRDCESAARPVYALLGARDALRVVYPNCEHDFPPNVRAEAYAFIDAALGHTPR